MKAIRLLIWINALSALTSLPNQAAADDHHDIQFVEDFVLASDREAALETLVPGTDTAYFYQCLHLQTSGQLDDVTRMLKSWRQRHGETGMFREIRNRQMLLRYPQSPKQTTDYLIDQLKPKLNHQKTQLGAKPKLPHILDEQRIDFELIKKKMLRQSNGMDGFFDGALDQIRSAELNPNQRRELLTRLRRPTHPDLVDMIVADLKHKGSGGFGAMKVHRNLTLDQLDQLSDRQPNLRSESKFVEVYLNKLQPNPDVDWQHNLEEQQAYLQRLWAFARDLKPNQNSLKALVLYRWLALDEKQGRLNRQRFLEYLRLPRSVAYIEPKFMNSAEARRNPVNLNHQIQALDLPPISEDEPLVRRYLLAFLTKDTNYRSFEPYIQDTYLKQVYAEAKITSGQGNPEKWFAMISPTQYQSLKERVDIDFAATNPLHFQSTDTVQLDLLTKNVRKLIVKIYEVNAQNFYRDQGREVNTDIQLDGLVPNHELDFEYDETPFLRTRRTYHFPQLKNAGVYVVDFIGNGKSSRAVVRKGQLSYLAEPLPDGHSIRVFNDQQTLLTETSVQIGGRTFGSDADGEILVPFSTKPGRQPIILQHQDFASLQFFQHQRESYKLTVAVHFDRESLLDRQEAAILLRPELRLNGTPVSPKLLENLGVTVTSTDMDGVQSSKSFQNLSFSDSQDTPVVISVPHRLSKLRVEVTGTITDHRSQSKTYTASHEVSVNQIDKTDKIEDTHLTKIGGQFVLQLLGKTGESRPHRAISIELRHRDLRAPIRTQLATNEMGFVQLGSLEEISSIQVQSPAGTSKNWSLWGDRRSHENTLHLLADQPTQIPHMLAEQDRRGQSISLFELRGGSYARDRSDLLTFQSNFIKVSKLPAGDYRLHIGEERTHLRVTAGYEQAGYAVGPLRKLQLRKLAPLQISNLNTDQDYVDIQLANSSEFARVHVYATQFVPAFDPFDSFDKIRPPALQAIRAPNPQTLYIAGRKLGDELQYVLERAYAAKFPGNMLRRPSLLLNSWPINDTQTSTQTAEAGDDFEASAAPAAFAPKGAATAGRKRKSGMGDFANLNFLARPSVLLENLRPDTQGRIRIPKEKLQSNQHIHVIAVDPLTTVYRSDALKDLESKFRNLRLTEGLDPQKHFIERKETSLLQAGETFKLADVTTATFDKYDSLRRVYDLFATVSGDSALQEFKFVLDWPDLKSEEKLEKYSEFACHELNFFLHEKDPIFFKEIVRPYLENKLHKTFLDLWLLDRDVSAFLQPWSFAQLNTVERILLADRLSDSSASVARLLADQLALLPHDPQRADLYFDTALAGRSLERQDKSTFEYRKRALQKNKVQSFGLSGGGTRRWRESKEEVQALVEEAEADVALDRRRSSSLGIDRDNVFFAETRAATQRGRNRLFRQLDKTKEWAETNYFRQPIDQQNAELIAPGEFWLDYAKRANDAPFFSVSWPSATRNFTEMMFALSVMDLPFNGDQHETSYAKQSMSLQAKSPMVVFHQQIRETNENLQDSPILIKQNYFRADDRYQMVQGQRRDKFIDDEFLTHVVYGCQVVMTNPTSSTRSVRVLVQIPEGAIATSGGKPTKTVKLNLDPYHTQTLDYFFYFPDAGTNAHFPAHVSQDETLLGYAAATKLNVVDKRSQFDSASWEYVSQFATDQQVFEYLETHSLLDIDLSKLAFRMAKRSFFDRTIELLEDRHVYDHALWAYGLKHNVPSVIATYLHHSDSFLSQCGLALSTELLNVDPVDRRTYQHLDYKPLVNARAHRLGERQQILNDRFHAQYHQLLNVLKYQPSLSSEDRITLTYYLLLQDRIEEAIAIFEKTERSQVESKLQYDYFAAYLDCYQEQPTVAKTIAERYANYPVPKWNQTFASIRKLLDELSGKDVAAIDPTNTIENQTQDAYEQASFELVMEGRQLRVDYQNLNRLKVNYYLVDLELLFSRNPFVQNFQGQFAHIRPNVTQSIDLPANQKQQRINLPEDLRNRNVLVELESNGKTRSQLYFSNSLAVQMSEDYGQLSVVDTQHGKRLPKVYVKVYAERTDGSIQFFKDGYTDLRGRFDYASLSTNQLDQVKRFSVLILDTERGGLVREARVPKR